MPATGPPTLAIDFGSRFAGTTVVVHRRDHQPGNPLTFLASAKKQDADTMVLDLLGTLPKARVFLDAPLSLPGVYRDLPGDDFDDYHYRRADRALNAMSPMFLGGLTARAMRLAAAHPPVTFHETYPAAQAKRLGLPKTQYKKSLAHLPELTAQLAPLIQAHFDPTHVTTWHHFDALLAWLSAERFARGEAETHGHPVEGVIVM